MSAMENLKAASWNIHLRMEKRLEVKSSLSSLADYRALIAHLEAFRKAAEIEWAAELEQALPDFPARRKAPLLARDLEALGVKPIAGAAFPAVSGAASALDALEGQTQSGRHLLPLAESRLGLSARHGASFLASYGPETGAMWQAFAAAVESHCNTTETNRSAIAAAESTFLAMEDWLCAGR
jgi:heme oxygenase